MIQLMSASHFLIYLVLEEKFKKLYLLWGMWTGFALKVQVLMAAKEGAIWEVTQCHTHMMFIETKMTLS